MLNRQAAGINRPLRILLIGTLLVIILTLTACLTSQASPTPVRKTAMVTATKTLPTVQTASPSPMATAISTATATQKPVCAAQPGEVSEVALDTTYLFAPFKFLVYLPPCYRLEVSRDYPLLILFHGIYNDSDQWVRIGAVETANRLIISGDVDPFIMVLPYDPTNRDPSMTPFDEIFLQDLFPYINNNYRILSGANYHSLGGVSRGAGWAIHFGLLYPELFGAIGAHSPIIFWEDSADIGKWLDAIPAGKIPRFTLDIGDNDPNRDSYEKMEKLLTDRDIEFKAHESPGYHKDEYWESQVENYIRWYAAGW